MKRLSLILILFIVSLCFSQEAIQSVGVRRTGGTATYLIAANNAPAIIKARADKICSGTADEVQIQAAIDAIDPNIGGEVHLSEGTFVINSTINLDSKVSLVGIPFASILEVTSDCNDVIYASGDVNEVYIAGLILDCNNHKIEGGSSWSGIHFFQAGDHSVIENVRIYNADWDGIRLFTVDNVQISDFFIKGVGGHSIMIERGSSIVTVANGIIEDSRREHICLEYADGSGNLNKDITINNVVGYDSNQAGIYVQHATGVTVNNVVIVRSNDTGQSAFTVQDSKVVALNNCIARDSYYGFATDVDANTITYTNCQAIGSTIRDFLLYADKIRMTNCMGNSTGLAASLYIDGVASDISLSNCKIASGGEINGDNISVSNCDFGQRANGYSVYLEAGASKVDFTNCFFTEAVRVRGNACADISFNECRFDTVLYMSINVEQDASTVLVTHNFLDAGTSGVFAGNLGGTTIRDNYSGYLTENWGSSTGTGAQQTIAHGLGATPTLVNISGDITAVNGFQSAAADATNIYITADNGEAYHWEAKVR